MGTFLVPGPSLGGWTVYRQTIPLGGAMFGISSAPLAGFIGGSASSIPLTGNTAEGKTGPVCKLGAMLGTTVYGDGCLGSLILHVRRRMNDFASTNRLLGETEASNGAIYSALQEALNRINDASPYTLRWSCKEFPARTLLLDGAILLLLESLIHTDVRNTVQYDAAGMSATEFGKHPSYMQIYQMKYQQWTQNVAQFKIEYNYNLAWGGVTGYGFSKYTDFWFIGY